MTAIGWIGTGVMGGPMAGHLLDAGHELHVFNRTRERADGLVEKGANWCDSPADVGAAAEVVCLMLGYPTDVRETVLGDGALLEAMRPGSLLIDFTTSDPTLAAEIAAEAASRDVAALDAPVSGGDVGARNAALVIMVGGDEDSFERARPLLEVLGRLATLQGGPGSGQHTKMMNQIAIASGMIGVCEALLYAYRAGLELETVLESVGGGAAGSWSLANYAPRMLKGDYAPGFMVEHFIKDMEITLAEARRMSLALPGLALAHELYLALRAQGGGRDGTQSLIRALARLSAVDWDR
jgi:3-hydroxyisobutyrate dehydrogenase